MRHPTEIAAHFEELFGEPIAPCYAANLLKVYERQGDVGRKRAARHVNPLNGFNRLQAVVARPYSRPKTGRKTRRKTHYKAKRSPHDAL